MSSEGLAAPAELIVHTPVVRKYFIRTYEHGSNTLKVGSRLDHKKKSALGLPVIICDVLFIN